MERTNKEKTSDEDDISSQMHKLSLKQEKVGFVFDERMLLHKDFTGGHVERPERAMSIYMNLHFKGLIDKLVHLPSEEITDEDLLKVHKSDYLEKISLLPFEKDKKRIAKNVKINISFLQIPMTIIAPMKVLK